MPNPLDAPLGINVGGMNALNPMDTMNSIAEYQNRLNQNRQFQTEFMANQALGEIVAHSGSLEDGLNQASQNPLIMGYASRGLANLKEVQMLGLQSHQLEQGMATSGWQAAMQAGAAAMLHPESTHEVFSAALAGMPPEARKGAEPFVSAAEEGIARAISGFNMKDPAQYAQARKAAAAVLGGYYVAGQGDPAKLQMLVGTVGEKEGIATTQAGPLGGVGGEPAGAITPVGGQPAGMAGGLGGPGGVGSAPSVPAPTNPATGEPAVVFPQPPVIRGADGRSLLDFKGQPQLPGALKTSEAELQGSYNKDELQSYNSALAMKSSLAQMQAAADRLNTGKQPWLMTGFAGQIRGELGRLQETYENLTGNKMPEGLPDANADVQAINKWMSQLSFQVENHYQGQGHASLGALRQAASAIPGMENTPLAFKILSTGLTSLADWEVGRRQFKNAWIHDSQNNPGGFLTGSDDAYNAQASPLMVARKELSDIGVDIDPKMGLHFTSPAAIQDARARGLFGDPDSEQAKKLAFTFFKKLPMAGPAPGAGPTQAGVQ